MFAIRLLAACAATLIAGAVAAQQITTPEMPTRLMPPPVVPVAKGNVVQVGPKRALKLPSEASKAARDGDVVEIDAGEYLGDVALWKQNNITIRGVGGRAVLRALGRSMHGKAIWVTDGNNVRIENIEFAEVRVADRNGAGVRAQGGSMTFINCVFRDSEESILTTNNAEADMVIERSEFARLGHPSGQAHGIYVGLRRSLTIIGSSFRDTQGGHHIKSRAGVTVVAYNQIVTGEEGRPSYEVEMPSGGLGFIVGNVIQQGKTAENTAIISHSAEGAMYTDNRLFVVNNTIVNELDRGVFVYTRTGPVTIANNILLGGGRVLEGPGVMLNNLLVEHGGATPGVYGALNTGKHRGNVVSRLSGLANVAALDLRPRKDSLAIGAGIDVAAELGLAILKPEFVYAAPRNIKPRPAAGLLDIGAYPAGD